MSLRRFQTDVLNALQQGRSVILQAPTGSGKTRAALAPFLYHLAEDDSGLFPRKCIYSVPMRVLANQFFVEYDEILSQYALRQRITPAPRASLQTGENPNDPKFEDTLIFTTIDQTLASFLNVPYGVGNKFANLNAGAVMSSYLVFDEFHLFGTETAMHTTLEMLKMLKGITPFVLMTATFSRTMLEELADKEMLDADIIPPLDADVSEYFSDVPSQGTARQRIYHWVEAPLRAEDVAANLGHKTICIVNTVDRARKLASDLRATLPGYEITLLHSQFFQADRDRKESDIRRDFYNASDGDKPRILVATQVIEVGLDISCEVMHTELSPASSLLQRAGRCARRADEVGHVFVYQPEDFIPYVIDKRSQSKKENDEGQPDYSPESQRNLELMTNTLNALQGGRFTDRHLDFASEQELIDAVHDNIDKQIVSQLDGGSRLDKMLHCIGEQERGLISDLIRDGDGGYAIIHEDPNSDQKLLKSPWHYQGLSVRHGKIARAWKEADEAGLIDSEIVPWVAMQAVPDPSDEADESERGTKTGYHWKELQSPDELYQGVLAIALHPNFAGYNSDDGLLLGHIAERDAPTLVERNRPDDKWVSVYDRETYAEHIEGLYWAYTRQVKHDKIMRPALRNEFAYVLQRIEENYEMPNGKLDELIRLMFAVHDLGKLSVNWQRFAHEWQNIAANFYDDDSLRSSEEILLAHTDVDNRIPELKALLKAFQKKVKRGNHAGESAIAAAFAILDAAGGDGNDLAEDLARAIITAIARHHTPSVKDFTHFVFSDHAKPALAETLQQLGLEPKPIMDAVNWSIGSNDALENVLVEFSRQVTDQTRLYMLFARILRLADMRSMNARQQYK